MSDSKAIKLKDMVHSLASTMVVTSQFLDQSTVDLQNLYAHSGSGALAALTPPRFTLDEVVVDLSFVVEEVTLSADDASFASPTEVITLASGQRQSLLERLRTLSQDEQRRRDEERAEGNRIEAERRRHQNELKQYQLHEARLEEELAACEKSEQKLDREIQARKGLLGQLKSKLTRVKGASAVAEALKPQLEAIQGSMESLKDQKKEVARSSSELRSKLVQWKKRRPEPAPSSATPQSAPARRLAGGEGARTKAYAAKDDTAKDYAVKDDVVKDYAALWENFERSYTTLKARYAEAIEAYQEGRALPKLGKIPPLPEGLKDALKRAQVAAKTLGKITKIFEDHRATKIHLGAVATKVAESKGEGILVRVDPEAIAEAPDQARQQLHLVFRSESQDEVQLEGEESKIAT